MILVGNKKDLDDSRKVTEKEGKELADYYGIEFFETSAKDTINIDECFQQMAKQIVDKMAKNLQSEKLALDKKKRKKVDKGCC